MTPKDHQPCTEPAVAQTPVAATCISGQRLSSGYAADPQHDVSVHGRLLGTHPILFRQVSEVRRHCEGQQRGAAGVLVHSNEEAILFLHVALTIRVSVCCRGQWRKQGGSFTQRSSFPEPSLELTKRSTTQRTSNQHGKPQRDNVFHQRLGICVGVVGMMSVSSCWLRAMVVMLMDGRRNRWTSVKMC